MAIQSDKHGLLKNNQLLSAKINISLFGWAVNINNIFKHMKLLKYFLILYSINSEMISYNTMFKLTSYSINNNNECMKCLKCFQELTEPVK